VFAKLQFVEHVGIIEAFFESEASSLALKKMAQKTLLLGQTSFETRVKSRGMLLFFVGEVPTGQARQADEAYAQQQQRAR
jgi:hypothetical protein